MRVKFKLYDPDFLCMQGHDDAKIRSVPFYLYVNKEFEGNLNKNDVHYGKYIIPCELCQYIKLKED